MSDMHNVQPFRQCRANAVHCLILSSLQARDTVSFAFDLPLEQVCDDVGLLWRRSILSYGSPVVSLFECLPFAVSSVPFVLFTLPRLREHHTVISILIEDTCGLME